MSEKKFIGGKVNGQKWNNQTLLTTLCLNNNGGDDEDDGFTWTGWKIGFAAAEAVFS